VVGGKQGHHSQDPEKDIAFSKIYFFLLKASPFRAGRRSGRRLKMYVEYETYYISHDSARICPYCFEQMIIKKHGNIITYECPKCGYKDIAKLR